MLRQLRQLRVQDDYPIGPLNDLAIYQYIYIVLHNIYIYIIILQMIIHDLDYWVYDVYAAQS